MTERDERVRALIRSRMAGSGNYIVCTRDTLKQARALAAIGDTISVHPDDGDGPPTLYEVMGIGLRELRPEDK